MRTGVLGSAGQAPPFAASEMARQIERVQADVHALAQSQQALQQSLATVHQSLAAIQQGERRESSSF